MPREIEASVQMKLYTLTKRQLAVVFLVFLSAFFLTVLVGVAGPKVIITDLRRENIYSNDYGTVSVSLTTSLLSTFNQQLWLVGTLVPLKNYTEDVNGDITPKVYIYYTDSDVYEQKNNEDDKQVFHRRHISCHNQICNPLLLLHLGYIDKQTYEIKIEFKDLDKVGHFEAVEFEFKTYRPGFTQLELWFRVAFVAFTFIVTIWYSRTLRPYVWKDWSIEQKWMMFLLPLLLFYNNPLFALAFLVSSSVAFVLDGIFQATFLSVLLLFWLCIYHSIRQTKRRFLTFYLPKSILVGLIWLAAVVLSSWQAVNERDDPTYNYRVDTVNFMGFKVFLCVMAGLYTLVLLYYLLRAFIELRNVAYFDVRLKFTTIFIIVIFSISLAIIILRFGTGMLDENFVADISTRYGSSAEFLSFYGLLNFYIYTMAYVYSPSKNAMTESRLHDNPIVTMLNESEDEENTLYGNERNGKYQPVTNFMRRLEDDSD